MPCLHRSADKVEILFKSERRVPVFARPRVVRFGEQNVSLPMECSAPIEVQDTIFRRPNFERRTFRNVVNRQL